MDAHTCRHTHICADFPSTCRSTPAHRSPHTNVHTHKDAHTGMCTQIRSSTYRHVHRHTNTAGPLKARTRPHAHKRAHSDRLTHKDTGADPSHTPPHRNTITEPPRRPLPTTQTHTCRNAHARTHTIAHTHRLLTTETHTHTCWPSQTLPKQTCTHIPVPAWPSPQLEQAAWAGSAAYSSTKDPFPNTSWWIGTGPRAIVPTMPLCKSAPAAPLCPPSYPGS